MCSKKNIGDTKLLDMKSNTIYAKQKWMIILLLFSSVDTALFGTNGNRLFLWIPRIMGLMIVLVLNVDTISSGKRIKANKRTFLCFAIMNIVFFASCFYNKVGFVTIVSRFISILVGFVIAIFVYEEDFFSLFDDFLYLISIIAIFTEVIAYVAPHVLTILPTSVNTAGYTFSTFFVGGMLLTGNIGNSFIRASAIFWEPGAFAFYLLIGIMYQLFKRKVPSFKRCAVFVICLTLTFSTTGYIVLGVMIIGYTLFGKMKYGPKFLNYIAIVGALVLIIGSLFSTDSMLYQTVFAKLFNGTSSATTRYSSFFNGMKVAIAHPMLGVGNELDTYMESYVSASKYSNGGLIITNTIVAQFASYGCIFGLFFLCGTVMFFRNWTTSKLVWITLALAIILAYMGERYYSFLPFVFVFYGFSRTKGTENI